MSVKEKVGGEYSNLLSLALAATFVYSLETVYIGFLSPRYAYLGFSYLEPPPWEILIVWIIALLPSLFLPQINQNVKDFAVWILYYTIYIPSIFIPVFQGYINRSNQILLIISFLLSFAVILLPTGGRTGPFEPRYQLSRSSFWLVFWALYVSLNAFVLYMFWSKLKIAGIADVYIQRSVADDVLTGSIVGYATGFLAGAFNPFLMAQGLWRKKPILILAGITGQVLVYATAAMKGVALSIVLIPALYFVLRKRKVNLNIVGTSFAGIAFVFMILIDNVGIENGEILNELFALIYMRTFCMAGVVTGVYADFFSSHPLTFYSHINLVSRIVPYPYDAQLGIVIGDYLVQGSGLDANGNFLATDGIAAIGFAGVVLAGLFFRIFIRVLDGAAPPTMLPAVCASIAPILMGVSNSSLFTTVLTGGGGLLVLLTYCCAVSSPMSRGCSAHEDRVSPSQLTALI